MTKDLFSGAKFLRACLEKFFTERYENFMSIDWLPHDETRRFPDHVYTERAGREQSGDICGIVEKSSNICTSCLTCSKKTVEFLPKVIPNI